MKTFLKTMMLSMVAAASLASASADARDFDHDRDGRGGDRDRYERGEHYGRGFEHGRWHPVRYVWYRHHYGFWRGNVFVYDFGPGGVYPAGYYEPVYPVAQPPVAVVAQPQMADSRYCREYHTMSNIGGQVQQSYGTACRQPDGSWQIVN